MAPPAPSSQRRRAAGTSNASSLVTSATSRPTTGAAPSGIASDELAECLLCEELLEENARFIDSIGRPDRVASMCESLVDCFGFCLGHGALFLRVNVLAARRVLIGAADRIMDLLVDESRYAERLHELFFEAEDLCPGCRLHGHALTQSVRTFAAQSAQQLSSQRLCFPHYRHVAYALDSAMLRTLAGLQFDRTRTVTRIGDELILQECEGVVGDQRSWGERLSWMLRMTAGQRAATTCWKGMSAANDWSEAPWFRTTDPACPVCAAVRDGHATWLAAVGTAARLGHDVWIVFPTCATHVWDCAQLNDPQVASKVIDYVAKLEAGVLERGIQLLERHEDRRRIASKSVWFRRQSRAYILGQQRKIVARMPRCPGCERSIVARDGAVTNIVGSIRGAGYQNALARTRALCLKHFAAVYLLLPPDEIRGAVVAGLLDRLRELRQQLDQPLGSPDDDKCTAGEDERLLSAMLCFSSWT